jgi:hypothetical protein
VFDKKKGRCPCAPSGRDSASKAEPIPGIGLGILVFTEKQDASFRFEILASTKIVPDELV